MGNCIKKESSMQWGGEIWISPSPVPGTNKDSCWHKTMKLEEDHLLMGENKSSNHFSRPSVVKEVKIKITKKQLSELMEKANVQGLSVHQLLSQLMNVSDKLELRHRSWRPALKSIPEVN